MKSDERYEKMHAKCQEKDDKSEEYVRCMDRALETRNWLNDQCVCIDAARLVKAVLLEDCKDLEDAEEKAECRGDAREAFKIDRTKCQDRLVQ